MAPSATHISNARIRRADIRLKLTLTPICPTALEIKDRNYPFAFFIPSSAHGRTFSKA
jgi:hypothetical protein